MPPRYSVAMPLIQFKHKFQLFKHKIEKSFVSISLILPTVVLRPIKSDTLWYYLIYLLETQDLIMRRYY